MTAPITTPAQVGTLYRILGFIALVGLLVLDILAAIKSQLSMVTLGINAILLLTILALIRPEKFNNAMKAVAAKLLV